MTKNNKNRRMTIPTTTTHNVAIKELLNSEVFQKKTPFCAVITITVRKG